jgi:hypothetical protein
VSVTERFRDVFRRYTPWWLSDRSRSSGKSVGYRFLWAMIAPLDAYADVLTQGLQAAWPGRGTPTALPLIGRSRGIIRGMNDSDDQYAAKLRAWLDRARGWGSALQLAIEIHDYVADNVGNHPTVKVINRAGHWVIVDGAGNVSTANASWNWDGVYHPERAGFWSDEWIVIQLSPWALRPGGMSGITNDGHALGHLATLQQVDEIKGIIAQVKGAASKVRAVIWSLDASLFDPTNPATRPDGTWGAWGGIGSGSRVVGGRNLTSCRYWEPR